ncbi:thioredoxin-like protein [Punctularia strigosozonata HHB-11173 SS5]|uniref:Thioredoxin-like protein n=1 Tax=Punctularia strigosozonata (strain HHB-11173) TaxID=741275 RepID=R7S3I2_PUNST|nr:thioredoxin-like protein [Punctularia strigosozonata HHB-11173 SS5]EIN03776.1 thioredoxin-like protein [Punctularia strigosozonata HHB-11173 SS5]
MQRPRTIKFTVFSDWLCPWCYINQRELEIAIERCADLPLQFEIEYRPFRLNDALSDDLPVNKTKLMSVKYGADKWAAMQKVLAQRGAQLGITFSPEPKMMQTTRAHRLMLKAWQLGGMQLQQAFAKKLFKALFEDGQLAGDAEVLSDIAEQAGVMTKDSALDFLETDECQPEVEALIADARRKGVSGVPFNVIDGKWVISGGQTADVFVQIFNKLAHCEHYAPAPVKAHPEADQCPPSLLTVKGANGNVGNGVNGHADIPLNGKVNGATCPLGNGICAAS